MKIVKRDGIELVEFDRGKIVNAIIKAMDECEKGIDEDLAWEIAEDIELEFEDNDVIPTVESVSDRVEELLAENGRFDVSRRYILFRSERAKVRNKPSKYKYLSNSFLKPYISKKSSFTTELGRMVYKRTYSRPVPEDGRREDWWETVARVVEYSTDLEVRARKGVTEAKMAELIDSAEKMYDHMFNLGLFPSGRSLWIGGTKSAYQYPISNFNCSFVTIDELAKFSEIFFVLMLGTGAGLSVERKYIDKLPKVNSDIRVIHKSYTPVASSKRLEYTELKQTASNTITLNVGDSKFGWSNAMDMYFEIISSKQYSDIEMIVIDYDNVRPKGERLKTFGGYASGHENLKTMFSKIDFILKNKQEGWIKLKPIDALDFATIIAENVISGGVRRSALIVFTDTDDEEVIQAKSDLYTQQDGQWVVNKDILHRSLSNNTIKYYSKPSRKQLNHHIKTMRYTGEPGFDNMEEAYRRRADAEGFNPCNEIILRDRGVCNLTEVNMARYVDDDGIIDYTGLYEAQKYSAIIGYRMATVELEIHKWNLVNVEDRLVGCSLTGMTDFMHKANLSYEKMKPILRKLRKIATDESSRLASELGMNEPKLVTAIKPSGTVSQLPTVASGLHFNHSKYYIRRVRVNADDPIAKALVDNGFIWHPEVGQTIDKHDTKVFEFPVTAPGNKFKGDVGAIEQLEWYKIVMKEYVDHNASITVHVRDNEWDDVEEWIYNNWDDVLGVSFLPYDGGVYTLAPYEEISEYQYNQLIKTTPVFDTRLLNKYENFEEEFDVLDSDCDSGVCPIR